MSAGFNAVVSVSTTSGGTYTKIAGLNDASLQRIRDLLDTTNFKDANDAPVRKRIYGLKDRSLSLSGDLDLSDSNGQVLLSDAIDDGTNVFIKYLPDGTNGWQVEFLVENFDMQSTPDGKNEFSCSLQATGDATAIP